VNASAAGPPNVASSSIGLSTHDTMGSGSRRMAASSAAHVTASRDVGGLVDADRDVRAHDLILGPADDPF
jgi:hypothetical protein